MPRKWSEEEVRCAIEKIRNGRSFHAVSKETSIPKSTLFSKMKGSRPMGITRNGKTILNDHEENSLKDWLTHPSQEAFPVTKRKVMSSLAHLLVTLDRPNPFPKGIPGKTWFTSFLRRHQQVSTRVAQNLANKRKAQITDLDVHEWFEEVQAELEEKGLVNVDGSRYFICDDANLTLLTDKALPSNNPEQNRTVLVVASADGVLLPPLVMYTHDRFEAERSSWTVGVSSDGGVSGDAFLKYVVQVVDPWLTSNVQRPVVFFVNGHSMYFTMPVTEFCASHGIVLVPLFPKSTHVLQPEDVGPMQGLKRSWMRRLDAFRRKKAKPLVQDEEFPELFQEVLSDLDLPKVMEHGFRVNGLFPFDPRAVDYSKFPSEYARKVLQSSDNFDVLPVIKADIFPEK